MKRTELNVGTGKVEVIDLTADEIEAIQARKASISAEQFSEAVGRAIDTRLDSLAKSWQYRDYISARSYVGDVSAKYAAEGAALAAYGSQCWTLIDQLAADVQAGRAQMPASVEAVLALLPAEPTRPSVVA